MNKEKLEAMKVDGADGLRKLAASYGIKNVKKYKKAELIDKLINMAIGSGSLVGDADTDGDTGTNNIDNKDVENKFEQKMRYIVNAPFGTLVAFRLPNGKVKSAKIVNRASKSQKLKLETAYGRQYIIPYSDVVWIKSTSKWPRGVYNQLKGIVMGDGENGTEAS